MGIKVRRITAEELKSEGYLLGFLKKSINKGGSGRIQRTLLESEDPLSLEEILEISAKSDEGIALTKEARKKKGAKDPFDIDNPTNRGIKTIKYFTNSKFFYEGYPAIGRNSEGEYFLTKISDYPELSETQSLHSDRKIGKEKPDYKYLPTKNDCERVMEKISDSTSENETDLEEFLTELEKDLAKKGKNLKSNWKIITEENLKLWSS